MEVLTIAVYRERFTAEEKKLGTVTFDGKEFSYDIPKGKVKPIYDVLEKPFNGFSEKDDGHETFTQVRTTYEPKTMNHLLAVTNWRMESGLYFGVPFLDVLTFFLKK